MHKLCDNHRAFANINKTQTKRNKQWLQKRHPPPTTKSKESRMESLYVELEQEYGNDFPPGLSEGTVIELLNVERKKSLYLLPELDERRNEMP